MAVRLIFAIMNALILSVTIHYYLYQRLLVPLAGQHLLILQIPFFILWSLNIFGFFLIRILPSFLRKFLEIIMFTWMGCAFILFSACVVTIPLQIYFHYFGHSQSVLSLFVLFAGFLVIIYAIFQALREPAIMPISIPVPLSLSKEVEDIKVVVISDIHVSGLIGKRKMKKLAQRVNGLNPDFLFITGDLMDGSLEQLSQDIEPLKNLRAKEGIIYITGNHEYYSGPLAWKNHFENNFHWSVLSNSAKIFKLKGLTLNVLGVEDKHWLSYEKIPRKHDYRFVTAVENLLSEQNKMHDYKHQENSLNIMLAHQPKDVKYLKSFPWIHLQISGHTHGGQIWPFNFLVLRDQKYVSGLYEIQSGQFLYVNQGTGFWGPPMRLGTRSEITLMKFKRQE